VVLLLAGVEPTTNRVSGRRDFLNCRNALCVLEHRNPTSPLNISENIMTKTDRPWGWYDVIDSDKRYKVKSIEVKPGERLSLQMHHHRAEHWVVVEGTALVQVGDEEKLLTENESTYIPIGSIHRLSNPGKIPLRIIEVQSGSYLEEDDITRLEDVYGRLKTQQELNEER
tara:strand:- start:204 stop:713 length:510 start_codon:yes stop_codon:yes gene_type:complete